MILFKVSDAKMARIHKVLVFRSNQRSFRHKGSNMLSLRSSALITLAATATLLAGCNQNNTVDPDTSEVLTRPVARFEFQDSSAAPAAPQEAAPQEATPPEGTPPETTPQEAAPTQTAPQEAAAPAAAPAAPAAAASAEDLLRAKNCLSCHKTDIKLVGPSYKDVAAKYAGQNVTDTLAEKVIKGGSGVWGPMPMTPNNVTPEEAKLLVTWILSLK
jgi:cytochrome c